MSELSWARRGLLRSRAERAGSVGNPGTTSKGRKPQRQWQILLPLPLCRPTGVTLPDHCLRKRARSSYAPDPSFRATHYGCEIPKATAKTTVANTRLTRTLRKSCTIRPARRVACKRDSISAPLVCTAYSKPCRMGLSLQTGHLPRFSRSCCTYETPWATFATHECFSRPPEQGGTGGSTVGLCII